MSRYGANIIAHETLVRCVEVLSDVRHTVQIKQQRTGIIIFWWYAT